MKRALLTLTFALLLPLIALSQEVTTFLGIPIDGTKKEMIKQLKKKGFKKARFSDYDLKGEFNGRNVLIYIVTTHGKVWRILVMDNYLSRITAIRYYNELITQFNESPKYSKQNDHPLVDEHENIRDSINLGKQLYEANYSQSSTLDPDKRVWFRLERHGNSYYQVFIAYDNRKNMAKGEDL